MSTDLRLEEHVAALILHATKNNRNSFFEKDFEKLLSDTYEISVPSETINRSLEILKSIGGLRVLQSPLTGTVYKIDQDGARYYFGSWPTFNVTIDNLNAEHEYEEERSELQANYPILVTFFDTDEVWIARVADRLKGLELSRAQWSNSLSAEIMEPTVSLSPQFSAQVEELRRELEISNEARHELGDQLDRFIAELKASEVLTKTTEVRTSVISRLLLPLLRFLAEKFAGGAIGKLAAALVELLLKVI